ncbi:hypothetical protein Bca52824_015024 [Brassica carinata]|uniref:TIR domain-containing protein n=1 Tax=Brassica carinata TaxID=52824 RepID=A0A8X7W1S2_BRACI|nr:hypothetical protein Bca52824_015024 [Brassica carinata]
MHSLDREGIISVTSSVNYISEVTVARQSRVAIVIISKNYTSLDLWVAQLAEIVAYKKETVPVFLQVDPLDCLRFLNLAEPRRNTLERVKKWLVDHVTRNSIFCSADWEDDSQLVDKITCFVSDSVKQDFASGDNNNNLSLNLVRRPQLDSTRGRSFRHHSLALELSSVQEAPSTPLLYRSELSRSYSEEEAIRDKCEASDETINKFSWWDQLKMKISPFVKHTRPSETIESSTTTYQVSCEEALGYIGTYDFKAVGPTILELEEDEANLYPLYSFTLQ